MLKSPINSRRQSVCRGQALIEFVLVLPLLFLLFISVLNFGGLLYSWITVSNAARTGVQYMMMGSATIHSTPTPNNTQISDLVKADLKALPNWSNASVVVCRNFAGASTCSTAPPAPAPTIAPAPVDPESSLLYCLGTVDVVSPYQPFVRTWRFTNLGINLLSMFSSDIQVHRRAAMRMAGGCAS